MLDSILVINPILYHCKRVFIDLADFNLAVKSFCKIFNSGNGRCIGGFVSDIYSGEILYCKPIVKYSDLFPNDLLITSHPKDNDINYKVISFDEIFIINPMIHRNDRIAIWGAGHNGKKLFDLLKNNGYDIAFFIDKNAQISICEWGGVEVIHPTEDGSSVLLEYKINVLIESIYAFDEIESELNAEEKIQINRFYNIEYKEDYLEIIPKVKWSLFAAGCFGDVTLDKSINVLIRNEIENTFLSNIKALGRDVNKVFNSPLEILETDLEENAVWLIDIEYKQFINDKKGTDFYDEDKYFYIQCMHHFKYFGFMTCRKDTNLAYMAYKKDLCELPGIYSFGNKSAKKTIVTLGDSMTDPGLWTFETWTEILQKKFNDEQKDVNLICGGVIGYTSYYVLERIIRDILPLHPYAIIHYSGYSDMNSHGDYKYPFENNYIELCYKYLDANKNDNYSDEAAYKGEVHEDFWNNYLDFKRMTYAVLKEFGIKYYDFATPTLITKSGKNTRDKLWVKMIEKEKPKSIECAERFKKEITNIDKNKYPYLYDSSGIFDYKDVYIDHCHVNKEGHSIIAEYIYEVIQTEA